MVDGRFHLDGCWPRVLGGFMAGPVVGQRPNRSVWGSRVFISWKASIAGSASTGVRSQSDPMLPYAIAFNVAQPWLNVAAPAPPWFRSRGESSLRGPDLDAAYHAFMHAVEWWLTGRSEDAAKAAAQWGYEEELRLLEQLDLESPDIERPEHVAHRGTAVESEEVTSALEMQSSFPIAPAVVESAGYQTYRMKEAETVEEEAKGGGCLCRCFKWLACMAVIGGTGRPVQPRCGLASRKTVSPELSPNPDTRADRGGRRPIPGWVRGGQRHAGVQGNRYAGAGD